ncbi:MAG: histidine--tRNA ligase [Gemmatimonadaceae bacterium]|nr:histidine--tRNA ligase [Gemmatimonadaceae bacterium]NUQ92076.1 histidine--tRNA ligase [Gemmatimonadaceae bacterium]NUR20073.1 histidine--tRNA ligase [Gemmatimonadaceae bacterium]NUS96507.1 histidine--tRNA ligase [Gemmatimonadaceae bacterium]
MAQGALPGFRDFYPQELAERAYIMSVWREVARRYAFVEYDGPPLEPLELYTKKSGEEIVGQLYNFDDKGGRQVALRPEMTPTVARMVGARANALRKPVRWFSIPQLFRYERQQKGRLREHYQLNVDIFGEASVAADAELMAAALDMMRAFGLGHDDVRARVSDRRLLRAVLTTIGAAEDAHEAVFAVIDKVERTPRAVSEEKLRAAGLEESATGKLFELLRVRTAAELRAVIGTTNRALDERLAEIEQYLDFTARLGVGEYVQLDLTIVRGLAYYTGIVFELFDAKGEFRAIAGGGRYDTLLASLGGVDLPALGFGMGDVVLGELLRARGLMKSAARPVEVWVAGGERTVDLQKVMSLAASLRAEGLAVEYSLRPQQIAKQFKAAATAGAKRAVIVPLATDAVGGTEYTIRDLDSGEQTKYPDADAVVRALAAAPGAR